MKTVVIPSDFSLESTQIAESLVRNEQGEIKIIFTHLFYIPDDIQDLLFSNYRKREYDFVSTEFNKEISIIKNLYPQLVEVKIEFFYGGKLASFKNFLEYYEVDEIGYSESFGVKNLSKSSIDAVPIIKKCGLPLVNIDEIVEGSLTELTQV